MTKQALAVIAVVVALAAALIVLKDRSEARPQQISLTKMGRELDAGRVAELGYGQGRIDITLRNGTKYYMWTDDTLLGTLELLGYEEIPEGIEKVTGTGGRFNLMSWIPVLLVVVLIGLIAMRVSQTGNLSLRGHGKSGARRKEAGSETVTFGDVAGVEEAKEELQEVVQFLRDPARFRRLGARIPTGVLLVGPPGTGKTLLARAVAGEAGVPFFSTSGSEFVEMYVGVGASRARDLFRQAKKASPAIIFIDEIDAVGRRRGQSHSHEEREQTLNQLLVEMDGFDSEESVVVVAATNRADVLDAALLRPGRFDRRIMVDRPDLIARKAILEVHTRGKPLGPDVDLGRLARTIPGFVGADISNLVNEAAILAARRDLSLIGQAEFSDAIDRIIAGPLRKNRIISDRERRVIAVHEAGHAVVMHYLPECNAVQKVSIVARGQMGGYTMAVPEQETSLFDRPKLMADLAGLLGGRVAEEIVVGEITTGASNDMERATKIAREMVTRYGMSDKLGPIVYDDPSRDPMELRVSDRVAEEIDREVQRIVADARRQARRVLSRHRSALDSVTQALIADESLECDEFVALCDSAPVRRVATEDLETAATGGDWSVPANSLERSRGRLPRMVGLGALVSAMALGAVRIVGFLLGRNKAL